MTLLLRMAALPCPHTVGRGWARNRNRIADRIANVPPSPDNAGRFATPHPTGDP